MDKQKFDLILDRLLEKTEKEKLDWEKTAAIDTFLVVFRDSSISISREFGQDPNSSEINFGVSYTFDFRNENGSIVESVSVSKVIAPNGEFEKVEKLYNLARRQSLQADKTVDRILEQLAA